MKINSAIFKALKVRFPSIFLGLLLCIAITQVKAATVAAEMNSLVSQGLYQQAFAFAQTHLFELEGEVDFDFNYGLAAIETGHASEAVFAFERILYSYPDQQRVKLELARAHFHSNNLYAAKQLFNEVLETNPDSVVEINIETFLTLIEIGQNNFKPRVDWYLTTGVGSDSNINSATELGIISTHIGDIALDPNGQSIDDNFFEIGAGLNINLPTDKFHGFTIAANYTQHNNIETDEFDLDLFSAEVGYVAIRNNSRFYHGLRMQGIGLDKHLFQSNISFLANWQHISPNNWSQNISSTISALRYDTSQLSKNDERNVDQILLTATITKTSGKLSHNVGVYYGDERALKKAGKDNAQQFHGVSIYEQVTLSQTQSGYLRLSYQESEKNKKDDFFAILRADTTLSLAVGWNWKINKSINIIANASYTKNDSNLDQNQFDDLFAYDRIKYHLGLQYRF